LQQKPASKDTIDNQPQPEIKDKTGGIHPTTKAACELKRISCGGAEPHAERAKNPYRAGGLYIKKDDFLRAGTQWELYVGASSGEIGKEKAEDMAESLVLA
jgi:hypothetical protein